MLFPVTSGKKKAAEFPEGEYRYSEVKIGTTKPAAASKERG